MASKQEAKSGRLKWATMNPADGPFSAAMRGYTALGRFGTGDEIASLVEYLAGPGGGFVTGASINIDGGFAA